MNPLWLPPLLTLDEHRGDWDKYLDALYDQFKLDFRGAPLKFRGKRVGLKRNPVILGREATFWHFISEGSIEEDRTPDMRRCERIAWPKAIIENCEDSCLKIWSEEGSRGRRTYILCEDAGYIFILAEREDFVLPWTAYPLPYAHQVNKFIKRWRTYSSTNG